MKLTTAFRLALAIAMASYSMNGVAVSKVVENPPYAYKITRLGSTIRLTRLELTDTATMLSFTIKAKPGWKFKIEPDTKLLTTGKREHRLTHATGVEAGKWTQIPPSGSISYSLGFEPIGGNTDPFDCIEPESRSQFNFYGIRTDSASGRNDIPEEWSHVAYGGDETLPPSFGNIGGTCVIKGKVIGFSPSMVGWYVVCSDDDPSDKDATLKSQTRIDSNGTFTLRREVTWPTVSHVSNELFNLPVIIAPNCTTEVLIDMARPESGRTVAYKGDFARTCHELSMLQDSAISGMNKAMVRSIGQHMTPRELRNTIDSVFILSSGAIKTRPGITTATKQIMKMQCEESYLSWLTSFPFTYKFQSFYADVPQEKRPERYEEYMSSVCIHDTVPDISHGIPRLECVESEYITYSEAYSRYMADGTVSMPLSRVNRDFITMHNIAYGHMRWNDSIVACINDPVCRTALANLKHQKDSIAASLDANVFYNKLNDIAPESVIDTILARHKGRAVLIDVWATWCQPCHIGHRKLEPLKDSMATSPIDYVYITGPTSSFEPWTKAIKAIKGEHYYLTEKQYESTLKLFRSEGVPTYAIYDRSHRLIRTHSGFPGAGILAADIRRAAGSGR